MASPTAGLRAPAEDAARLEGGLDELLEQREMLRGEVMAANHRYAEMRQDYEKLETALEECEGQKKELAAAMPSPSWTATRTAASWWAT